METVKDHASAFLKTAEYLQNLGADGTPKPKREPTVYDAVKAGLLVPTQNFVEKLGPRVLSEKDDKGYTAAHWACLGGHTQILRYLIDNGAALNTASDPDPQSLPIHWAATNGHIAAVDLLLQQGVSIDSVDGKGCTPLIVACQYGQTMLAGYLMGKGAKLQITDKDGDNALHWAAFKGHAELIRLLVYSGFKARQRDNYGQTALHLACINGDICCVRDLADEDGVELELEDKNGKTPYMLAAGRNHSEVMTFLRARIAREKSILGQIDVKSLVFGPPGRTKKPILFSLFALFFWCYPLYLYKCLYQTWEELWWLHVLLWIGTIGMWISLYLANSSDPGYLPRNVPEYDMAIKQVAHYNEWKDGVNPLKGLCHTCRGLKPIRSKHCRICDRCVDHFDHHCPWIYNCVGFNNRQYFYSYLVFIALCTTIGCYFLYLVYCEEGWSLIVIISLPMAMFFTAMADGLCFFTTYQVSINTTTNEQLKWKKYDHMKDASGEYRNPFNRGIVKNLQEYFHYIPPRYMENPETVKVL